MAIRSETGQALANAVDQPVEAGRVVGVYALALDRLRRCQRLAGSLLGADHVESRRTDPCLPPGVAQASRRSPLSGAAVEDQERHAGFFRDVASGLALILLQVGGIDHHRIAGLEDLRGQLVKVRIGRFAGLAAIDAGGELAPVVFRLLAEQTLAFDIRAQAHGAQSLHQTHGHLALADRGDTMGDRQEARGMAL